MIFLFLMHRIINAFFASQLLTVKTVKAKPIIRMKRANVGRIIRVNGKFRMTFFLNTSVKFDEAFRAKKLFFFFTVMFSFPFVAVLALYLVWRPLLHCFAVVDHILNFILERILIFVFQFVFVRIFVQLLLRVSQVDRVVSVRKLLHFLQFCEPGFVHRQGLPNSYFEEQHLSHFPIHVFVFYLKMPTFEHVIVS